MTTEQQRILDHYKNPRNFGKPDWEFTHYGKVENLSCGDMIEIFIKVEDGIIDKCNFYGEGCSLAISAGSILSEALIGQEIKSIISKESHLKLVNFEVKPTRQKCILLSYESLQDALRNKIS